MKFKLIKTPKDYYNGREQVLINRGINFEDINHYCNLTADVVNDPIVFGKELMDSTAQVFLKAIEEGKRIAVIVDCDCDGYTSSSIIINYIYDIAGAEYAENKVHYFLHESKQHGLEDAMEWLYDIDPGLIIIPDAGSNDVEQLKELYEDGHEIIILDHHELEVEPYEHCYLINSQLPQYPNKDLSGAGVTWQFCRYIDSLKGTTYAEKYLDLVALGLTGDMMSLKSFETKYLICEGLKPQHIFNPFVYSMWQENLFKLGNNPTSWGVTFYIVPFVNAITRSGTLDEKTLIFESMLKFKAFKKILSDKKGHKFGEEEQLIEQAVRVCSRVKRRQTKAETEGLALVEHLIEDKHMMDHKVLLFLLEPGQIQAEIRGLIANKLMAKYQRPCCILTKTSKLVDEDGANEIGYEGSARGCDKVGITEFKDLCSQTGVCNYTIGHQGAFGLGIPSRFIPIFVDKTDELLKDMSSEPMYYVDYIWNEQNIDGQKIMEIGEMGDFWGKDVDESLVAVKDVKITKENIKMMASNTMKITLPNGISIIKFRTPDEEYNDLYPADGSVYINIVAKCNKNVWNGYESAQLLLEDYEVIRKCAYEF